MHRLTRARIIITAGLLSVAALLGSAAAALAAVPAVHHAHVVADDPPKYKP